MAFTKRQREQYLQQLTLAENAPPDPDLALEGGVPAPQQIPQGQSGERPLSGAVVGAVKKDKLKRNRRRAQIVSNFQDDDERRKRGRL